MALKLLRILLIVLNVYLACAADDEWDYFVFAHEWPGTFCQYKTCSFPAGAITGWNIHGLWPSSHTGKDPFFCKDSPPFDKSRIQSIFKSLQMNWADLLNFDNPIEFWKHEWDKHGSCAVDDDLTPDELHYFNASLTLKYSIALDRMLLNGGIQPSNDKMYTKADVVNAIQRTVSKQPKINCIKLNDNYYLNAVELCTDRQFNLIDCHHPTTNGEWRKQLVHGVFAQIGALIHATARSDSLTPVPVACDNLQFYLPMIS